MLVRRLCTWLLLGVLAYLAPQSEAYAKGAPKTACEDMRPGHLRGGKLIAPQTDSAPFEIITSADSYRGSKQITVTIKATGALKFKGFMLQARRYGEGVNDKEPIGFYGDTPGTQTMCRGVHGNALTHVGGSPGSDDEKTSLSVIWSNVRPTQGHVQFRLTVVVQEDIFWVAEKYKILMDESAAPLPTTTMKPPPVLFGLLDLSTCGTEKGCYRNPPGCNHETCDMLVTWRPVGDNIEFELSGDSSGWVAVGFSQDQAMGSDDVTECVWYKNKVWVRQSYNRDGAKQNDVLDKPEYGIDRWAGQRTAGRIQCKFQRKQNIPLRFDLRKEYYILLAKGDMSEDGRKLRHTLEPGKYPWISRSMVSLMDTNGDYTHTTKWPWVKVHGCLMLIAWMMCASTAVLMAKYYKPMWPNDKLCGERVWFAVHRGCLIATLVCTVVGFIVIFCHRLAYSTMPELPDKAHPPLGITVTILCILNPLIALCRPRPKSKWRPVFNWIHWFLGLVAMVLATPTLFIGLNLHKAFVPWWATWVLVAFMLFHLIIELLLEIHGCLNSRKQESRTEEFELRKKSDPRGEYYGLEPEPVGTRFKKTVLAIYVIVVIILGLVMVIAVAAG